MGTHVSIHFSEKKTPQELAGELQKLSKELKKFKNAKSMRGTTTNGETQTSWNIQSLKDPNL